MRSSRLILKRKAKHRVNGALELQLTSLIDIMVIVLVFLLKSFAASTTSFQSMPGVELPTSASQDIPPDSFHLVITPEKMVFEDAEILVFSNPQESFMFSLAPGLLQGSLIEPLYNVLMEAKEKTENLILQSSVESSDPEAEFPGILAIQSDKRVPYDLLRKIMWTAGSAGYRTFRFLALRKEE